MNFYFYWSFYKMRNNEKNIENIMPTDLPNRLEIKQDLDQHLAMVPKIANHTNEPKAGTSNTPVTNSLIVLPREIRAMNTPTNGAQAIHQAQ